ncbi:uncharacterized protein B0I36DRAFT_368434 [Microdochium trichocladiopsis]|uniref:Uncharacterized protein n=1 Tax=Microdochium trichocladiopsis TaxID=1682393 RepID=A0A9P8XW43_9PEZI|nr:uncharacterized protein B0I36DRAFT_368434 [Microdochium trichocladiopsis]KAH7018411.1 hypothetical protein B0I36DRAFT_368434 [Microdochium trichocladiopsis]
MAAVTVNSISTPPRHSLKSKASASTLVGEEGKDANTYSPASHINAFSTSGHNSPRGPDTAAVGDDHLQQQQPRPACWPWPWVMLRGGHIAEAGNNLDTNAPASSDGTNEDVVESILAPSQPPPPPPARPAAGSPQAYIELREMLRRLRDHGSNAASNSPDNHTNDSSDVDGPSHLDNNNNNNNNAVTAAPAAPAAVHHNGNDRGWTRMSQVSTAPDHYHHPPQQQNRPRPYQQNADFTTTTSAGPAATDDSEEDLYSLRLRRFKAAGHGLRPAGASIATYMAATHRNGRRPRTLASGGPGNDNDDHDHDDADNTSSQEDNYNKRITAANRQQAQAKSLLPMLDLELAISNAAYLCPPSLLHHDRAAAHQLVLRGSFGGARLTEGNLARLQGELAWRRDAERQRGANPNEDVFRMGLVTKENLVMLRDLYDTMERVKLDQAEYPGVARSNADTLDVYEHMRIRRELHLKTEQEEKEKAQREEGGEEEEENDDNDDDDGNAGQQEEFPRKHEHDSSPLLNAGSLEAASSAPIANNEHIRPGRRARIRAKLRRMSHHVGNRLHRSRAAINCGSSNTAACSSRSSSSRYASIRGTRVVSPLPEAGMSWTRLRTTTDELRRLRIGHKVEDLDTEDDSM